MENVVHEYAANSHEIIKTYFVLIYEYTTYYRNDISI